MQNFLNTEPAMLMAFIQAVLTLLVVFGLDLSDEQVAAILAASGAALGLVIRQRVTPVKGGK